MSYTIIKTNGTVLTTIADGTVDNTSTSLELPGRNYAGYGVVMDTNFVHLLENFADSVVPSNPIKGQLWYNTTTQALYVCPTDGETDINNWYQILTTDNLTFTDLTISGNIVANNAYITNDITSNSLDTVDLTVTGNANLSGNVVIPNVTINTITTGTTTGSLSGNWSVSGNISPTGIKTSNYYYSNGVPVTFQSPSGPNLSLQYNLTGSLAGSSGLLFTPSSNALTVTGNVTANNFIGNGAQLTSIPSANLTGNLPATIQSNITTIGTIPSLTVTGNITSGNLSVSGNISATRVSGSLTTNAQPNITSVGTLTGLTSVGNINFVNTSNVLLGNIANLKILGGNPNEVLITNGSGDLQFVNQSSIVSQAAGSNTQVQYNNNGVLGASSNFTFNNSSGQLTINGNIASLNANLGNAVVANFFIGNGYNLSNVRGANVIGPVSNATIAGTVYTNAQPNITSVGTLTSLTVSGPINAGTISALGFDGNVSVPANGSINLSGSQSEITGANRVSANFVTGTLTTASQPNITSIGTLLSLGVSGTIVASNANLGNAVRANFFIGDGSQLSNLNISNASVNTATFATSAGTANTANTVTNSSQPNITTVGILNYLDVFGTFTAGNIVTNGGVIASSYTGNGWKLGAINGSNVSQVSNATFATNAGIASVANFAGNVTLSSQPNITSLGTLISLNVTGNVTAANFIGNGSSLTNINGANVTGTVANATYATSAGSALSVAGANVTGTVANANYASFALNSTTATSANSANTANIANTANTANFASTANISNSAISAASANNALNLTGGNITSNTRAVTQTNGDNSTKISTTAYVQNMNLGWSQTWSNVTSSRTSGVTYYNLTGKPIQVNAFSNKIDSGFHLTAVVDGVTVTYMGGGGGGDARRTGFTSFIVPNGSSYSVTYASGATGSTLQWAELR